MYYWAASFWLLSETFSAIAESLSDLRIQI
jgi:hypothetical protein